MTGTRRELLPRFICERASTGGREAGNQFIGAHAGRGGREAGKVECDGTMVGAYG